MSVSDLKKRPFPSSHGSQERSPKDHRRRSHQVGPRHKATQDDAGTGIHHQKDPQSFAREQTRLNQINQIQEAEKMREWVSKEDEFVLQQSKKKATIRVREGRARTIDWLVVTLAVIDGVRDPLEEEEEELDVEVVDPTGVFDGLTLAELQELSRDIETYLTLEQSSRNRTYWRAIKTICNDHIDRNASGLRKIHERSQKAVSADVDRLLGPKTLKELEVLEGQIRSKLRSNDPIDVEYWEQLLHSVGIYKSKAELRALYESIIESRLRALRQNEAAEADLLRQRLSLLLKGPQSTKPGSPSSASLDAVKPTKQHFLHSKDFDPDPMLRLRPEDKSLEIMDEKDFVARIATERSRVQKLAYIPSKQTQGTRHKQTIVSKNVDNAEHEASRFAAPSGEDFSSATTALYEREVARGIQDNEEIFTGEEEVTTKSKPQWADKHRPRKPRYFNRVQMGYEWNKYNQTHYDHDNPPPKVVQGYKFNIFYPDLIDKTKAPTYRIERENGRKRGETAAPAGEEDTCLIRFISGPPYEDIAFRILDKKWDLSAQRERGFRSSFDKTGPDSSTTNDPDVAASSDSGAGYSPTAFSI